MGAKGKKMKVRIKKNAAPVATKEDRAAAAGSFSNRTWKLSIITLKV
jgi:hypothetical protein